MRLPRKFLRFDYGVHILLGILAVASIVLTPLSDGMSIWFLLPIWFFLGAWQLLSALILVFGYKDETRAYYLLGLMVYVLVCAIVSYTWVGEYMIFLSLGFAGWYAYLTYKDATYRTPSFWDLEF